MRRRASLQTQLSILCRDMNADLMKAGHAGLERTVWIPFLELAFAVSCAHNERVVVGILRTPIKTPERPS